MLLYLLEVSHRFLQIQVLIYIMRLGNVPSQLRAARSFILVLILYLLQHYKRYLVGDISQLADLV
ncbi:hypothetical protein DNK77_08770 [Enterobacter cloacae complex sp.]|nr:hypothetical protein DNK77_08770 [Enterobacter cloacae complex sp.]